ncbi:hypothetical protein [Aeromonas salmonicida]|uniref:hypothetical protein n=1 Tax=Aeromonas salmonicida TaxID=645 RepID=UPI003D1C9E7F
MNKQVMPRYLRVAHWLCEHKKWMTSREVAIEFGISPKAVSDDFSMIRKRFDLVKFNEKKVICKTGGWQYLMQVIHIHTYVLDERLYPRKKDESLISINPTVTWRKLLSCSWSQLQLGN